MGNVLQSFGKDLKHSCGQKQEVRIHHKPPNTVNGRQIASLLGFSTPLSTTFTEKRAAITCLGQKIEFLLYGKLGHITIFLVSKNIEMFQGVELANYLIWKHINDFSLIMKVDSTEMFH